MSKPSIYIITICWNESLFLPFFLEYYSFVDKIIIYDNFSSDNSIDIIKKYPNTEYNYYNTNEKIRDDIYLEIKNHSWKQYRNQADWIFIIDIDEIIYHPQGILNYLETLNKNEIAMLQCYGFEMFEPTFYQQESTKGLLERCNKGTPTAILNKACIINPKLVEETNYLAGCHQNYAKVKGKVIQDPNLKMLHYKFIVPLQLLIQRYQQMAKRLSRENIENGWGFHYANIEKLIHKFNSLNQSSNYVLTK